MGLIQICDCCSCEHNSLTMLCPVAYYCVNPSSAA